jgi:hypothetical protein
MELEFFRHNFEKYSKIKLNKNPDSCSRVVPCARTGIPDKVSSHYSQFCESAPPPQKKKTVKMTLRPPHIPRTNVIILTANVSPCIPWRHTEKVEVELHWFLISSLYGGEWLASRCGHFARKKTASSPHWITGWLGGLLLKITRPSPASIRTPNRAASSLITAQTTLSRHPVVF